MLPFWASSCPVVEVAGTAEVEVEDCDVVVVAFVVVAVVVSSSMHVSQQSAMFIMLGHKNTTQPGVRSPYGQSVGQ